MTSICWMQETATVGLRYAVETNQVSRDDWSGANRAGAAPVIGITDGER